MARIDHDFGEKWRLFATYRYMRLVNLTTNQVDIGGLLPGDTKGTPAAEAPRPQNPGYLVLGMTTNVTPTTTNEFRFNYTRNFWQWGTANAPPQLPGLGGAVEIASGYRNSTAESSTCANTLIPYNVGTQCTRQRFWDGQDKLVRDDVTMIKGNHLFQFGGTYQRNFDYHMRTDNGVGHQRPDRLPDRQHQHQFHRTSHYPDHACRAVTRATTGTSTRKCWAWSASRRWRTRAPATT